MGYQLSNPSNGPLGSIELIFLWKQSTLIALTYLFTFCNSQMNVLNDFGIFFFTSVHLLFKKNALSEWSIFLQSLYEIVSVFLVWMLTHYILNQILQKSFCIFYHLNSEVVHSRSFISFLTENKYPTCPAQSIPWLLMAWRRKVPGHQQPWYWFHSHRVL